MAMGITGFLKESNLGFPFSLLFGLLYCLTCHFVNNFALKLLLRETILPPMHY